MLLEFRWHCSDVSKWTKVKERILHSWRRYTLQTWLVLWHSAISTNTLLTSCVQASCLFGLVWKWISSIHHHRAWSAVARVMPSVKLRWDHGNIQLSPCTCQFRNYRYDGYLCQKGRFNIEVWNHTVINLPGSFAHILTYSMNNSRGYNDMLII